MGKTHHQSLADRVAWAGLILGPMLACVVWAILPAQSAGTGELSGNGQVLTAAVSGLSPAARATAAVAVLMAIWWLTEAIPLPATALLPLVLFPLLGAAPIKVAAAPYAHSVIFLFLGGFLLGLSLERCGLHKRLALNTLLLVGTSPRRLIAGFMLASAVLSMWVSNTATTIMMLPIAMSIITLIAEEYARQGTPGEHDGSPDPNFDVALLLGIAYAASIGGVATLIGTPPNAVLKGFLESDLHTSLGFAQWMGIGLPVTIVFLPVCWAFLVYGVLRVQLREIPGGRPLIISQRDALGPMSKHEWIVLGVFLCTIVLWIARPFLGRFGASHDIAFFGRLNDSSIAIGAALMLFLLPVDIKTRTFAMDWETARKVPWGILLLFGGGLSLAATISSTGLDVAIGHSIAGIGQVPSWLAVVLVCSLMIFLTELTSNTAVTTALLPIIAAAAPALGVDPIKVVVPAALAASFAFMLPVATPPNAIVFGSGHVRIGQMARAGLGLNILGIIVISLASILLEGAILDISAR